MVESILEDAPFLLPTNWEKCISMERVEVEIRIPMQFAGKASSAIRGMAAIKKEEWKSDSWVGVIEIPAGMQSEIFTRLNELTSGQAETRVIKKGL